MSLTILGIWGYSADSPALTHDSGAAVIQDGKIISAVNEERFSRKKIDGQYPFESIRKVLKAHRIGPEDIDLIALAGLSPRRRSLKMLRYIWKTFSETRIFMPNRVLYASLAAKKIRRTLPEDLKGVKTACVDHHLAHAASAYYTCPWEDATIITLDGIGDSATCGVVCSGIQGEMKRLSECNGYYSPGIFYSFITKRFGFSVSKHEGKITGLAAYGDHSQVYERMKNIISYREEAHDFYSEYVPKLFKARTYSEWELPIIDQLLDEVLREDVAAGVQKLTEDVVCAYVRDAVQRTGLPKVALAGGVFGNVKLNQRIRELECVEDVFVHPNMGDGGLAAGAALYLWASRRKRAGKPASPVFLENVYLGPEFAESHMRDLLEKYGLSFRRSESVEREIAGFLFENKIVGRFAGRMEYGPRALGNRSILAAPVDKTINDWLNKRLKRTEFMPFAPSILEEDAADFLTGWSADQVAARFMTITYDVPLEKVSAAPAVVHVDNTVRPQVVRQRDNPTYHRVILEYKKLSGLPLLINTSFNMHEEPIVCTPEDAIRSFLAGSVDVLTLDSFIVEK